MRLLLLRELSTLQGGIETYLQSLLSQFRRKSVELSILTNEISHQSDSFLPNLSSIYRWSINESGFDHVWKQIENWNPDLVYSHSLHNIDHESRFTSRYPTLGYIHTYNTCISGNKSHQFPYSTPCTKKFGLSCLGHYFPRRCGGLNPFTMLKLYQNNRQRFSLSKQYHALAFASNYMRDEYIRHGLSPDKCHLLPLPIPGQEPDLQPPDKRSFTNRLLFIGRLTNLKGTHYLLKALPELIKSLGKKIELIIAGDGPELPRLKEYTRSAKVPVEFTGWVNRQRREELMRSVDLLVVPSLWPEPFGLVGIEAGCVGLPAVAFEVGGIPDWLIPGETGELASGNPPRISGLTQAIVRALSDRDYHHRLRMGAWKKSHEFSMEIHIERLMNILQSLHQERS